MIIACPACATRYVLPDAAIAAEGRTVRCAKCRHSWFQERPGVESIDEPVPAPEMPDAEPPRTSRTPSSNSDVEVSANHANTARKIAAGVPLPDEAPVGSILEQAEQAAVPEPLERNSRPRVYEDDGSERFADEESSHSRFEYNPSSRPRRNRAKMWTLSAILFAVVVLGVAATAALYGLPDWVPASRQTFAETQPDLVLDFPPGRQDRRTLPDGTEFFGASGTISNIGSETRYVPMILIVLRDARDRIVYSSLIEPPKRELAPGETITINKAVLDVPKSATAAEIGWRPG